MAKKIDELLVELGLRKNNFDAGLRNAENKVDGFSRQVNKLGGTLAAAFGTREIIRFGAEAVKLAGIAEGVESAFSQIGDTALLEGLRKATRGTVSDLELMKKAVQANNFQIPIENLGSLFEFARRRAKATGESVDYLTQSLVTGLGRKSVLVLDNLGISASQLREELNGVSLEASSVAEISAAVGRIASKSFSTMGNDIETTAERTASLRAELENVKKEIGSFIAPAVGAAAAETTKILKDIGGTYKFMGELRTATKEYGGELTIWQRALNRIAASFEATTESSEKLLDKKKAEELTKAFDELWKKIKSGSDGSNDGIKKLINPITKLEEKIDGLEKKKLLPETTEPQIHAINKQLYFLNEELDKLTKYKPPPDPIKIEIDPVIDDVPDIEDVDFDFSKDKDIGFIEPIITQADLAREALRQISYEWENLSGRAQDATGILISNFANAEKGAKGLKNALVGSAKEIIAAELSKALAASISSSFQSSGNPILGLILAGAATAGVYGLFSQIPKLADGGLAYGNSIVNVGEYAGASSNPEVIAPLNKLQGMLGGGSRKIQVEFGELSISNEKLSIAVSRGNEILENIT